MQTLIEVLRAECERRGYELREVTANGVTTITLVRPDGTPVRVLQRRVQ